VISRFFLAIFEPCHKSVDSFYSALSESQETGKLCLVVKVEKDIEIAAFCKSFLLEEEGH
jgi:hypothetical protein